MADGELLELRILEKVKVRYHLRYEFAGPDDIRLRANNADIGERLGYHLLKIDDPALLRLDDN